MSGIARGFPRISAAEPAWPTAPLLDVQTPSRLDAKPGLMAELATSLHAEGLVAEAQRPWLMLCLDEAITNAMLHGNQGDPSLCIRSVLARTPHGFELLIADAGDGFTAESLPDPEDPASLLLEHGRGIRLMQQWLDDLSYFRGGSVVRLARHADPPASASTSPTGA